MRGEGVRTLCCSHENSPPFSTPSQQSTISDSHSFHPRTRYLMYSKLLRCPSPSLALFTHTLSFSLYLTMILFTKGTWLLLAAAAAASSALSVSAPGFFSAPGSAAPRPQLAKRWVSSFLGGATIDVAQPAGAGPATEPAVYSVAATWNVPLIAPNPGANLSDADNRHSVGHWVGITGGQCAGHPGGALFQAGTLSFVRPPPFYLFSPPPLSFPGDTQTARNVEKIRSVAVFSPLVWLFVGRTRALTGWARTSWASPASPPRWPGSSGCRTGIRYCRPRT